MRGTLRQETGEFRGIWIDILALAGDSAYGDVGIIQVANGMGWSDAQIATILMLGDATWKAAKQKLVASKRIKVTTNNVIQVLNWSRYQSEYERQKPYRLQDDVTCRGNTEKREERREIDNNIKTFDQFWSVYPKKVGKKAACKKWGALSPSTKLIAQMLEALEKQKQLPQWQDEKYIPHPATWIHQERWNDELPTKAKKKPDLWEKPRDYKEITL